jgi:hypothetical protein
LALPVWRIGTTKGTTTGLGRTGNGTLNCTLPTGWQVGDFAMICLYSDQGSGSVPTNWTQWPGSPWGTSTPKLQLFYKILADGEPTPVTTISGSATNMSHCANVAVYSGSNIQPDVTGAGNQGTGTPMSAAQITGMATDAMACFFCGRGDNESASGQTFGGSTTGVTERLDAGTSRGNDSQVSMADKAFAGGGSSGAGSSTTSITDPWVAVIVSIKEGAAPVYLAGAVDAVSAVSGAAHIEKPLEGSIAAISTIVGDLQVIHPQELAGIIAAQSAIAGEVTAAKLLAGAVISQSAIAGGIFKPASLAGSIAAQATAAGMMAVGKPLSGVVPAVSNLAGDLLCEILLSGSVPALSGIAGAAQQDIHLAGLAAAEALFVGDLSVGAAAELAGIIAAQAQIAGAASVGKPLSGSVPAAAVIAGDLLCDKLLSGSVPALSGLAGAAQQDVHLAALVAAQSLLAGDLSISAAAELAGIITAHANLSARFRYAIVGARAMVLALQADGEMVMDFSVNSPMVPEIQGQSAMRIV